MQHTASYRLFRLMVFLALIAGGVSAIAPVPQARATQDTITYLPIIMRDNTGDMQPPPPTGSPEQIVRDRLNYYRTLASSPSLQLHSALTLAAQNHASYDLLNNADMSAWVYGPHGEVANKPGYTGRWPGDRAVAAGYPWFAGWEVMSFDDDPIISVDGLMATVFHRTILLDPYMQYTGYGHGRSGTARVDVVDLGHGTAETDRKQVIVFPAAGQTNVPPEWLDGEYPNPLPPNAIYPVGYPITIQPIAYVSLNVTQAELRDSRGALVEVYPNPSDCGTACYALIPIKPLQTGITYTVHVAGTVDGAPFARTWTFTTTN